MFNRGEPPWPVRREIFRRGIAEYGNFRLALETSLAHGHAEVGLRLCIGLRNMWVPHGDAREAATWLDRFLVLPGAEPGGAGEVSAQVRGRALAVRAEIAFDLQDYDTLLRCATGSLELARAGGDDFPVPTALRVLGQAAARGGRTDEAVARIDEAIAAAAAAGHDWEAGLTMAAKAAIADPAEQAEVGAAGLRGRAGDPERQQPLGRRAGVLRDGHAGPGPRRRRGGGPVLPGRHGDLP